VKTALITGITGQDGSYLADLLLAKDYNVVGIVRRGSTINTARIDHLMADPRLTLKFGDVCDGASIVKIMAAVQPDEIYHLAAQSHVRVSFDIPEYTGDSVALGTTRMLEAMREIAPYARYYQASSSEMFGSEPPPQSETTPFSPRSPYACGKVYAYHMARNYRDGYGLHISNGILFNHESPRRGETFVTRKIAKAVAAIAAGRQSRLALGNLKARRDFGYAPEYVEAMWRMTQQDGPGDYVIATGEQHSVAGFCEAAFRHVGIEDWRGYVDIEPRHLRPTEVDSLRGDASKARRMLGWTAALGFADLVRIMVDAEVQALSGAA
jgi:GDPmannose 4,6-dehydratase